MNKVSISKKEALQKFNETRELAEADLWYFARLVNPTYLYGKVHRKAYQFLQDNDRNKFLLLPRGHLKSHCMATWCAWWIVKHPDTTIMYISATADLAEQQLQAVKDILTSDIVMAYWAGLVNPEEGKRDKWSTTRFNVDHPLRKGERVRDPTMIAAGLGTNTTGKHCNVLILDDLVVPDNAYTETGRRDVEKGYSQLNSILNTGGIKKACGTRYHPKDLYSIFETQRVEIYNTDGEEVGNEPVWDIMQEVVEKHGVFIWPRTMSPDGRRKEGFDHRELALKRADYLDRTQFYAQYYNNPNDVDNLRLSRDCFQYYDLSFVKMKNGQWHYGERPLTVFAAMDFAYTTGKRSDYTCIVVAGIDHDGYIYVLDILREKISKANEYSEKAASMFEKWGFKKFRVEVRGGSEIIVEHLKDDFRTRGFVCSFDIFRPTSHMGRKEERIDATLLPLYENKTVFHHKDGGCVLALEEELVMDNPPHDDIKDALHMVVEILLKNKPMKQIRPYTNNVHKFDRKFGGRRFR